MVSEAKEVIRDIQNSLIEQKKFLAFSAQQQEEVGTWCYYFHLYLKWNNYLLLTKKKKKAIFYIYLKWQGLQRSLVSAKEISKATMDFFCDLYQQASNVMTMIEESQAENSKELANFNKKFKVSLCGHMN